MHQLMYLQNGRKEHCLFIRAGEYLNSLAFLREIRSK